MAVKKATPEKKAVPSRKAVPAKKTATKAVPAEKTATKAVPATKTATRAVPAKKTATKAVLTKRATAGSAGKSSTPAARGVARSSAKASVTAAPLRAQKTSARASTAQPRPLRVREDETPWTAKELKAVRAELEADIARLLHEISVAESELAGLMRDAGDGSGDDQADAGTKTFEREQEISLANNARIMFEQSQHALQRIDDRSYGICESCGNPIGKNRLQAFPRATLCMPCKSKQERR